MDTYLGEIRAFANASVPRGWAACDGSLMYITSNTALFALIGVTYGGDGKTTFALPNLQGNLPVGAGAGQGTSNWALGQTGGTTSVSLTFDQMATHSHAVAASTAPANSGSPRGALLARSSGGAAYSLDTTKLHPLAEQTIARTGNSSPHNNMQPYLAINYYIAISGSYPQFE